MITEEMTNKLIDLYNPIRICEPRRKYVKIIVDSLLEQLSNKYFGDVPSGIMNMRRQLNIVSDKYEGNDKEILIAMKKILNKYNEVFTKTYSDYEDMYFGFLDVELRDLVAVLIKGSQFCNQKLAIDLGGII